MIDASYDLSGYPNEAAVHVALGTIRERLEELKQQNKVNS